MNNSKLPHQNSLETVIMSSSRRSKRACDTTINYSQQSIMNAMNRFVKSVENMNSTVLVPSKLRDMDISKISSTSCNANSRRKISQYKAPTILLKTDLYAFYLMLHDVKKELLWGPSSGMSAIASSGLSQSNGSINNYCNSSMSNNSSFISTSNNSIINNSTISSNFDNSFNFSNLEKFANSSIRNSTNTLTDSTYLLNNSNKKCLAKDNQREKHHSRQPSDDSLGSLGSTASTLDIDSESEVDSVLADRDSSNSQASGEHTLHLAAAFKHHLQGLHTILHQLADTADFFCARYQEEVDGLIDY